MLGYVVSFSTLLMFFISYETLVKNTFEAELLICAEDVNFPWKTSPRIFARLAHSVIQLQLHATTHNDRRF